MGGMCVFCCVHLLVMILWNRFLQLLNMWGLLDGGGMGSQMVAC